MADAGLTEAGVGLKVASGVCVAGQGVGEAVPLSVGLHEKVEKARARIASAGRVGLIFFMDM